ncbi:YlbD family protein [Aquibacillus albus]|uniref:Cytosolic protein n=1 Tax=Aquibacillus albus TaxID=1168171 RepID=A0ABS2N2H6_9BACI|nr:YlbD family protein [Aquibacillus albus]MBM7572258.1 hypothetical protein [Aquibacillus albus]
MGKKDLHPSIEEFKTFVKKHPGLIKHVRSGNESWQTYYEKWVLLGEDDPSWEKYKEKKKSSKEGEKAETTESKKDKSDIMNQIMNMVENVDLDKVEGHINQLNGAITNIQSLIGQFQNVRKNNSTKGEHRPPFQFNKD